MQPPTAAQTEAHMLPPPLTALQQSLAIAVNITDEGRELTQVLWRFNRAPDSDQLAEAWRQVANRHDALRVHFTPNDIASLPSQTVGSPLGRVSIRVLDTEVSPERREAALEEFLRSDRDQGVDLKVCPAWHLTRLNFAPDDVVLVWTVPHVLLDDYSLGRILTEVVDVYHGRTLAPLSATAWLDYARKRIQAEKETPLEWWTGQLQNLPARATLPKSSGLRHPDTGAAITLPSELTQRLEAYAQKQGVPLATVIKAAWLVLLWNQNGAKDQLVGQIFTGRDQREGIHADVTGMLSNILPLRVPVDPARSVPHLLEGVKRQETEARKYWQASFEAALKAVGQPPGAMRFHTIIHYEEHHFLAPARERLAEGESLHAVRRYAVPFVMNVTRHPELCARLFVREDYLRPDATVRLVSQFKHILTRFTETDHIPLQEVEWIEPTDRVRTVEDFNKTDADIEPGLCLHHSFERLAAAHPERIAVVGTDASLTYGELEARANKLANFLIQKGVKPRGRILLCLEKSARMIVAMFAVHKCGCAYVPVDPAWPRERVGGILGKLDAEAFVCSSEHALADLPATLTVLLDRDAGAIDLAASSHPGINVDDTDAAYLIFTSGSTGTPKGVQISHRGIVNTMQAFNTYFGYGPDDRAFCITALTFDPSIHDIFGLLSVGGAVVLCPANAGRDPDTWGNLIEKHQVTSWCSVPQLVQMLFEAHREHPHKLASLRVVRMGGDALPMGLPHLVWTICPRAKIANEGGVTEVSVCTTLHPVQAVDPSWQSVPYGKPLINQSVFILDEQLNPCPTLVSGDMYFGGRSLGIGYWKDEERTKKAYITHPRWKIRLYRTGDRGRFLDSGDLEFLGREDNQVKLGGFRIELGEIETTIRLLPWVKDAVTIKREVGAGAESLVAYVVPHRESDFNAEAVRDQCRARLPHYMVPAIVMSVATLPLTANGKIDRKALPEPLTAPTEDVVWSDEEKVIADIWEEVLGHRPDSPDRPFFEAGGTSLLAMRLIDLVKKRTGHVITMANLYKVRPSVRRMAADIAARRRRTASPFGELEEPVIKKWIVPLQPRGSKPPFFMLGNHHVLGRYFSENQPYYAVHLNETVRDALPSRSLSDIASFLLREIKRFQPQGPYYLGGYGFSAALAFELARYIHEKGDEVAYLALIEPVVPPALRTGDGAVGTGTILQGMFKGCFGGPLGWAKQIKAAKARRTKREDDAKRGLHDFEPGPVPCTIDLILARQSLDGLLAAKDPRRIWSQWATAAEVHLVDGNDYTVVREPAVEKLAPFLEARMAKVVHQTSPAA